MAFILANLGYDVWLSNSRGSKYSRLHRHLDADRDREFWNFSFEEHAEIDLPSVFDYIGNVTHQSKFDYIGHSQGTLMMFAALSLRIQSVHSRLRNFVALGPVVYLQNVKTPLVKAAKYFFYPDYPIINRWLEYLPPDFMSQNWLYREVASRFCLVFASYCSEFIGGVTGDDSSYDDESIYPVLVGHAPCGTSMKNVAHYEQNLISERFQKYDYGPEINL